MIRLNRNGMRGTVQLSGHVIRKSFDKIETGIIPPNIIEADSAFPITGRGRVGLFVVHWSRS